MKVTTGVDIIEVNRISDNIEKIDSRFVDKIFTQSEIEYCERFKNKYERYAARFAAKEAVYKALEIDEATTSWKDIEIYSSESGRPYVRLINKLDIYNSEIEHIDISISHIKELAIANVVICWK